ncbi:MAG: hypothetical protein EA347_12610 [Thioalkalivibrio sp.]|nr:MAG: hypothetical protein EA347_12610 [Thioalkalivibrio sp.]
MARFTITLHPRAADAPETQRVSIREEGELPEYGQVWVWDMLYAQQLYALADNPLAGELRELLELWAVNMSSKVFQPWDHIRLKGHLRLSDDLELLRPESAADEGSEPIQEVVLEVEGAAEELPRIRLSPDILPAETRFWLVLALAQYFVSTNDLFARELPIHLLAFRKYHADINLPETAEAAEEAPFYAIQKAMEYFQSAGSAQH